MTISDMVRGAPSKDTIGIPVKISLNLSEKITLSTLKAQLNSIETTVVEYVKTNYNVLITEKDITVELSGDKLNIYWRNSNESTH
jgi:hypothetical protein